MDHEIVRDCDELIEHRVRKQVFTGQPDVYCSHSYSNIFMVDGDDAADIEATSLQAIDETDELRPALEREEELRDLATFLPGIS